MHHNRIFLAHMSQNTSKLPYGIKANGWAQLPSKNYNLEIFAANSFDVYRLFVSARLLIRCKFAHVKVSLGVWHYDCYNYAEP